MITTSVVALAAKRHYIPGPDNHGEGFGGGDHILLGLDGVHLQNDGGAPFLLVQGYAYDLVHDGTGWRVTVDDRPYMAGHVHRIAQHGIPVGWLPAADGTRTELDPARRYQVRADEDGATLVEV